MLKIAIGASEIGSLQYLLTNNVKGMTIAGKGFMILNSKTLLMKNIIKV